MVRDLEGQISGWRTRLRQGGTPDAVLALAEHQNTLYAGLYQGGLLESDQRGARWHRLTER